MNLPTIKSPPIHIKIRHHWPSVHCIFFSFHHLTVAGFPNPNISSLHCLLSLVYLQKKGGPLNIQYSAASCPFCREISSLAVSIITGFFHPQPFPELRACGFPLFSF
uniref:Uncharacterized protein n=1 Tax=Cacopsylla melanoneura TaxID=428564 RepID=A0A8D9BPN4_9HEMI